MYEYFTHRHEGCFLLELGSEHLLEGIAILGKLLDTHVKLVECHLVLQELPPELGLIIDTIDVLDGPCGWFCEYAGEQKPRS